MKHSIVLGAFLAIFVFPAFAFAGPIVRSGDSVSVSADQVLDTDFYGLGSDVTISGEAKQDEFLAGGTVTVNAPVGGDLTIIGGTVQIHAPVTDDVRVAGGEVVIASKVGGDVVVTGGVLKILSTAEIAGDILYFGGQLEVGGPVQGSIIGHGETIRIDASVGHDVNVSVVKELSLGDRTDIHGDLLYKSPLDLVRGQKAIIEGTLRKDPVVIDTNQNGFVLFLPLLAVLFAVLTAFMLFRTRLQELVASVRTSYGMLGLLGLGVFLGMPFIAIVLSASVIGSVIGLFLIFFYIALLIGTFITSGIVLGTLALKPITHTDGVTLLSAIVGSLCFVAISLIPFIGPLFMFAGFSVVLGAICRRVYQSLR